MTSFRASMTLPLFGLIALLAGCSAEAGTSGGAESVDTAAAEVSGAPAESDGAKGERHAHHGRHGGPERLAFAALHDKDLNLSEEQRSAIKAALQDNAPKRPEFDRSRGAALAAAVRAGKVDANVVPPAPNAEARAARLEASAKTIATLHDTLTKEQRVALVDAVSKRMSERMAKHGPKQGEAPKEGADERPARMKHGPRGPMGGLLAGLDLTPEQREAIRTQMKAQRPERSAEDREARKQKFEAMRSAMQARLQTFANDDFDAKAFVTPPARPDSAQRGAPEARFAKDLAVIVSVLDQAQRDELATRLEQGPPAHMKAGHGKFRKGAKLQRGANVQPDAPKLDDVSVQPGR